MKQIRCGVFETNSSSAHSITMCSDEDYQKWKNGEVLYWEEQDKFGTKKEIIAELTTLKSWNGGLYYNGVNWDNEDEVHDIFYDGGIKSYSAFFDNDYYETYSDSYTTPRGDKVVAFGYYGYN